MKSYKTITIVLLFSLFVMSEAPHVQAVHYCNPDVSSNLQDDPSNGHSCNDAPEVASPIIERRHKCIPNPLAFGTDVSEYCNEETNEIFTGTGGFDTIDDVIDAIAKFLQIVAIPIATAAIIYSGILFFFNRGSEERLNKAKDVFKWTLIGVFLVVGVFVILATIRNFFVG